MESRISPASSSRFPERRAAFRRVSTHRKLERLVGRLTVRLEIAKKASILSAGTKSKEQLIQTINEEDVNLAEYRNYQEVYECIGKFLEDVYMHKRIHSALGYRTSAEFEEQWQATQIAEQMIN